MSDPAASSLIVDVLIPALNEEGSVGQVISALRQGSVPLRNIVVVDNGSTDATAQRAQAAGAQVVFQPQRGYGAACLSGLRFLAQQDLPPDAVVFLDADGSDDVADLPSLVAALLQGADLVIGSRTAGRSDPGSLQPVQRFGNALATGLIRLLYCQRYTDLGPFRVVRYAPLCALDMQDETFGWTVEMQVKAVRRRLHIVEVPVHYRRRQAGQSKISSTVKGSFLAGLKILYTIARYALQQ